MTDPSGPADVDSEDSGDVKNVALNRALLREFLKEQVGFQFAIAVIDDDRAREDTVAELGRELAEEGTDWIVIDLRSLPEDVVLLSEIRHRLEPLAGRPAAVGVLGLEWHLDIASGGIRDTTTTLLANANFQRDAFPELCPVPLVLWATSLSLPALPKLIPDLWHWRAGSFDLCVDPPDTPWADRLERMVPRPDEIWQAQPKEELRRRIELLRQVLEEIGSEGSLRRARLLLEFADVTERSGEIDQALTAAQEALEIATHKDATALRAIALGYVASLKGGRGLVDEALALHEEELAIYEGLGDARSRAVTLGSIARLKADRGFVDEALALHEQSLGIYEVLGDVRERAVALGEIARLKADRGLVDEALALHQEELSVYEELGDVQSRAATLGDIARLKAGRGLVDEALDLLEEELAVYEGLGDVRSRAVTLGNIARLKAGRGLVDEALALHEEELTVYEGLGDVRSRAVTLGSVARLKASRGLVDEALALHEERLGVFGDLGDVRSRAITLGDIARLKVGLGLVDEALALLEEALEIYGRLGDSEGQANSRWFRAIILLRKPDIGEGEGKAALDDLTFAHRTLMDFGRAGGIAAVGFNLAQVLAWGRQHDEARKIAGQSLELFTELGWTRQANDTRKFLDSLPPA